MGRKQKFGGLVVDGVRQKEQKNWGAQIVLVLGLGGFLFGATLAAGTWPSTFGVVGLCVCIAGGITLVVTAARALRTWDY